MKTDTMWRHQAVDHWQQDSSPEHQENALFNYTMAAGALALAVLIRILN